MLQALPQTDGGDDDSAQSGKQIATTTLGENRTTTVPAPIRDAEGLDAGDEVAWFVIDGEWVLRPAQPPTISLSVLEEYLGEPCPSCEDGTLVKLDRDGTDAVTCDVCETIRGELWNPDQ